MFPASGDMGEIQAAPAGFLSGPINGLRTGADALSEDIDTVFNKVLIIFDQVAAAAGKSQRLSSQNLRGATSGFENRHEQGAVDSPGPGADTGQAGRRTGEAVEEGGRQFDVG